MKNIGVLGPKFLFKRNQAILQSYQVTTMTITGAEQLDKIDGLIMTAWHDQDYLNQLRKLVGPIRQKSRENLVIMGLSLGAYALSRQGLLGIMACDAQVSQEEALCCTILEIPSLGNTRFNATFLPTITFSNLAPNLGVLCKERTRGGVLLRQGNFLACSFAPELTKNPVVYEYFLEMIQSAGS